MKKKQVAIILGLALCAASLAPAGVYAEEAEQTTEAAADGADVSDPGQAEEADVYGEIVSISESAVTINVGTRKEMGEGDQEPGEQAEGADPEAQEQESLLDLTGEEQEITITADTVISRQGMGRMGGGQGQAPDGEGGEAPDGEAPDMPDGEGGGAPDGEGGEMPDGEAPDMPDGEGGGAPDGEGGEMPDGESESLTWEDLQEGDTIAITLDADGNAASIVLMSMEMGGGDMAGDGQGGGGQSGQPDSYEAMTEYTEDTATEGETYTSTGTDENAVHVYEGASVTIKDAQITRSSQDSTGGDDSSFYGVGAALLVTDGSAYVSDSEIQTDAAGGAGLFAYGSGTVYASDVTISTEQDTSGGIHAAGGGTLYAWNVTAQTQGESSAAIRSDRGGGTMVVDGGTYTSNGTGSPAIYSTADIAVNDAQLEANSSEAICIEGLNSIHLFDSDLTGNMSDDERNDCTWNVILYQSMSGDSEVGNSTFEMVGGSLTAENGGMFYTTNTESTFILSDVDITCADDSEFFLKCTGNANQRGWGTSGDNGADCLFTAISQEMQGDVIWDSISDLDLYLTEGSALTGALVDDESNAGAGGDGYCNVYISEDSSWTVTGDSTLTGLQCAGTIVDENGNAVTITGTDGTVYVEGSSEYTITVESYQDSADLSGASQVTAWTDYEVEMPTELA